MKTLLLIFLATVACGQTKRVLTQAIVCDKNANTYMDNGIPLTNVDIKRLPEVDKYCTEQPAYAWRVTQYAEPAPKPELMDVSAIMNGSGRCISSAEWPCQQDRNFTCADKRRVLLTDEGGGKHCVAFPKESK